jgi:hypothetical protein
MDRQTDRWMDKHVDKDGEMDIHREIKYTCMDRVFNISRWIHIWIDKTIR